MLMSYLMPLVTLGAWDRVSFFSPQTMSKAPPKDRRTSNK